ncbi:MAG: hypothetical protein AMK74_02450 [Nitrospira bacterium SM23_35]|jgi:hypothetical protein|nr:MAG: hypothetical protein AMK74_02450 [Nitrospira bacterium SM23_35]
MGYILPPATPSRNEEMQNKPIRIYQNSVLEKRTERCCKICFKIIPFEMYELNGIGGGKVKASPCL